MEAWLKREARRIAKIEVPTAETQALDSIRKAVSMALDDRDIAVIAGDSGTGKTTALRAYAAESRSAIFVEVDSSFTKNVLVTEIARAYGAPPAALTRRGNDNGDRARCRSPAGARHGRHY